MSGFTRESTRKWLECLSKWTEAMNVDALKEKKIINSKGKMLSAKKQKYVPMFKVQQNAQYRVMYCEKEIMQEM